MPMKDPSLRNMTRFTYEFTSFQGWRVALCRKNLHFIRYFSDGQYGGEQAAYTAALFVRDRLMELLNLYPDDPETAFARCLESVPPKLYPKGVGPCRTPKKRGRDAPSD